MTDQPFKSPIDEAAAIDRLLESDLAKKLETYSQPRLASFKSDAMKARAQIRLSTYSQPCSHEQNNR